MGRRKNYLYLALANVVFFGIYILLIWIEDQKSSAGWNFSWIQLSLYPLIIVYGVVYGIWSYKSTRKIWIPNTMLYVFVYAMFAFIAILDWDSWKPYAEQRLIWSIQVLFIYAFFFTSFSLISSFTAKSKIDKKEKASESKE